MKNILLLITDTYRYDNLGDRSALQVRTPELDRFAATRAAAMENFYAGSFPTIPHRTDLATGFLGWPHYGWQALEKSGRNPIASILGDAGYATQLICDCPHLFKAGFNLAFDAACHLRGQENDRFLLHLNDPIETVLPADKTRQKPLFRGHGLADVHRWMNRGPRCEADTFASRTASVTARWLEENHQANPWFLWVDFFDPHEPWDPPEYFVRRYDPDYEGTPMLHPNYGPSSAYTPEELRNLRAHYAAEAELVDRCIGRVLQKMDDLQLWEETVVVITSDHGFSIGEHGRTGKSNISEEDARYWPIYPEIGHVPFLVAAEQVNGGTACDALAQPQDILPTLCDLAGASVNPVEPFQGRSFAGVLQNGQGEHRSSAVTGRYLDLTHQGPPSTGATTPFLVTRDWGYAPIGSDGDPELYDLAADPGTDTNVAEGHPDVLAELRDCFLDHLHAHGLPETELRCWREVVN